MVGFANSASYVLKLVLFLFSTPLGAGDINERGLEGGHQVLHIEGHQEPSPTAVDVDLSDFAFVLLHLRGLILVVALRLLAFDDGALDEDGKRRLGAEGRRPAHLVPRMLLRRRWRTRNH